MMHYLCRLIFQQCHADPVHSGQFFKDTICNYHRAWIAAKRRPRYPSLAEVCERTVLVRLCTCVHAQYYYYIAIWSRAKEICLCSTLQVYKWYGWKEKWQYFFCPLLYTPEIFNGLFMINVNICCSCWYLS